MPRADHLVQYLISKAIEVIPGFSQERIHPHDLHRLLSCAGLRVTRLSIDSPAVRLRGTSHIVVRPNLSYAAERYFLLRELGRSWLPVSSGEGDDAARVFALAGLLNAEDQFSRGPRWLEAKVRQLEAVPGLGAKVQIRDDVLRSQRIVVTRAISSGFAWTRLRSSRDTHWHTARHAYEVGRIFRQRGDYESAKGWYRQSIEVGLNVGELEAAVMSTIGMGVAEKYRGNYRVASTWLRVASRRALRFGFDALRGAAYHELVAVAAEVGDSNAVDRWAQLTFDVYGPEHPRLPSLAHDVAHSWLVAGEADRAMMVFRSILPRVTGEEERLFTLANLARAAGEAGDVDAFVHASQCAEAIITATPHAAGVPEALFALRRGAVALGDSKQISKQVRRIRRFAMSQVSAGPDQNLRCTRLLINAVSRAAQAKVVRKSEAAAALAILLVRSLEPA